MGLKYLMENYAGHNEWANGEVVDFLKAMPTTSLAVEVQSSFSTILETLHHIVVAQVFWRSVVAEETYEEADTPNKDDASSILTSVTESAKALRVFTQHVSEGNLEKEIQTPWIKVKLPVYDVLQHCFNHSSHHRGQLTTMFHQLELKNLPNVDYYEYLKIKANGGPIRPIP